jgi:hypothetical protein
MKSSEAVVGGYRRPLGFQQITAAQLAGGAVVGLTLPTLPKDTQVGMAQIQSEPQETGIVRWRDDGVDPTSTIGMILPPWGLFFGDWCYYGDMSMIRFIAVSGSPILNISFYE